VGLKPGICESHVDYSKSYSMLVKHSSGPLRVWSTEKTSKSICTGSILARSNPAEQMTSSPHSMTGSQYQHRQSICWQPVHPSESSFCNL
jgi:hypothetical protein